MAELRRLWRGEMPLERAFWIYAVVVGIAVNMVTSALFVGLIAAEQPWAALIVGYGVSIPYNIVATVGVWRAADHHPGDPAHARLARGITLIGMLLLSLT